MTRTDSAARPGFAAIALAALVLMAGCATAPSAQDLGRNIDFTGFLPDYSKLRPGGEGRALLVYRNPRANFRRYEYVLLEPIAIWAGDDSVLQDVPEAEQQLLVDYLDPALRESLARDYTLVDRARPGTMRIRVAITEAAGSNVVVDTISSVVPQLRLLSGAARMATGTQAFVGRPGSKAGSSTRQRASSCSPLSTAAPVRRTCRARRRRGTTCRGPSTTGPSGSAIGSSKSAHPSPRPPSRGRSPGRLPGGHRAIRFGCGSRSSHFLRPAAPSP